MKIIVFIFVIIAFSVSSFAVELTKEEMEGSTFRGCVETWIEMKINAEEAIKICQCSEDKANAKYTKEQRANIQTIIEVTNDISNMKKECFKLYHQQ